MFLVILTVVSSVMTIGSGGITIYTFVRGRPMRVTPQPPPSLPSAEAALPAATPAPMPWVPPQPPSPTLPAAPLSPGTVSVAPTRRRRLSYPRLFLFVLIGQILYTVLFYVANYVVAQANANNPNDVRLALGGLLILAAFPILILLVVCLIYGLVKAAQVRRWGWFAGMLIPFVVLLLFATPAIGVILFALRGPTEKRLPTTNRPAALPA